MHIYKKSYLQNHYLFSLLMLNLAGCGGGLAWVRLGQGINVVVDRAKDLREGVKVLVNDTELLACITDHGDQSANLIG